jgi:hypothetical protein
MSKFKIYRIDHYDPIRIGKHLRKLHVMFGFMSLVFIVSFLLLHQLFNLSFVVSYLAPIPVVAGFYIYIYRKLKAGNQKMMAIGDIEFSRTSIMKHIGDSSTAFNYNAIKTIELIPYIPATKAADSKSGFFTYILCLNFKDNHKESLVVSDKPLEESRDLSITETLKTLRKIISAGVIFK